MAHPAQTEFCLEISRRYPEYFRETRVLEIGSRNVNGTLRDLFTDCHYTGLDCTAGPDVDVVCLAHEFEAEPDSFDVICSAEALEHDPYADHTVARMRELLRPGGLLLLTCAGEGRREHGTSRTGNCYGPDPGFYRTVGLDQLVTWLAPGAADFAELLLRYHRPTRDLYCAGITAS